MNRVETNLYRRKPKSCLERIWFWVRPPKPYKLEDLDAVFVKEKTFHQNNFIYAPKTSLKIIDEWIEANYEPVK